MSFAHARHFYVHIITLSWLYLCLLWVCMSISVLFPWLLQHRHAMFTHVLQLKTECSWRQKLIKTSRGKTLYLGSFIASSRCSFQNVADLLSGITMRSSKKFNFYHFSHYLVLAVVKKFHVNSLIWSARKSDSVDVTSQVHSSFLMVDPVNVRRDHVGESSSLQAYSSASAVLWPNLYPSLWSTTMGWLLGCIGNSFDIFLSELIPITSLVVELSGV